MDSSAAFQTQTQDNIQFFRRMEIENATKKKHENKTPVEILDFRIVIFLQLWLILPEEYIYITYLAWITM